VSGRVRQRRVSFGTCTSRFSYSRDVFGEVWFVSGRVLEVGLLPDVLDDVGLLSVHIRRGRVNVGTCSEKSVYCRDLFGNVGLVSVRVRRIRLSVGNVRRVWLIVGTFLARLGYC